MFGLLGAVTAPTAAEVITSIFSVLQNDFVYPFVLAGISVAGLPRIVRALKGAVR